MKRVTWISASLMLALIDSPCLAWASSTIQFMINDRLFVPVRALGESLGDDTGKQARRIELLESALAPHPAQEAAQCAYRFNETTVF